MACDRIPGPPPNLKPISNSNLSPPDLFGPEAEGIRLNYWGAGRQSMKGRWRPGFGVVVSLPEAERGKRLQPRPAPDIPVRPSTSPSPSPKTTLGGAGRAGSALAGGACNRSRGRGRATHHRLHREKVVRPRCAVRLASTSTHQAARPCWCWSMACTSSLGQLSATSAQPSDPNLGTAPQGSD